MSTVAPPSKEEIAIIQLRDRIPDILAKHAHENFNDDLYLMRWLKAKNLNAEKTEHLIRNSLNWRIENSIELKPGEELQSNLTWNYEVFSDGVDNDGTPVFSLSPGSWKLRECIIETGEKDNFVKYMAQVYVIIEEAMIKFNRERCEKLKLNEGPVATKLKSSSGVIVIVDMKGYSRHQLTSLKTVECCLEIASMLNYFPDLAQKIYFINVSKMFSVLFKMIKPLVNLNCEFFDVNEEKWKAHILSHIRPESLRPAFGGTKLDPCMIKITTCENIVQCSDFE